MQKLRTVIVDDEPLAREFLRLLLSSSDNVEVVAECSNGKEAVAAALELRPDLLFLDIQMPGMNGFDVVKTLSRIAFIIYLLCVFLNDGRTIVKENDRYKSQFLIRMF